MGDSPALHLARTFQPMTPSPQADRGHAGTPRTTGFRRAAPDVGTFPRGRVAAGGGTFLRDHRGQVFRDRRAVGRPPEAGGVRHLGHRSGDAHPPRRAAGGARRPRAGDARAPGHPARRPAFAPRLRRLSSRSSADEIVPRRADRAAARRLRHPLPDREGGRAGVHRGGRAHRPAARGPGRRPRSRTRGSTRKAPACWKRCSSCSARRERFFAMVNHELRNALAGVFGWAEMMVRKKDPATVPKAAFEVLDSADQAIALVNDLLDLSRLDEDRLKPVDPRGRAVGHGATRHRAGHPAPEASAIALSSGRDRAGRGHPDRRPPGGADPHQPARERHPSRAGREHDHACGCWPENSRVLIEVLDEGPGVAEDGSRPHLRHLPDQGSRGRSRPRAAPVPPAGAAPGGRPSRRGTAPGSAGCFILELPAWRRIEDFLHNTFD